MSKKRECKRCDVCGQRYQAYLRFGSVATSEDLCPGCLEVLINETCNNSRIVLDEQKGDFYGNA